MVFVDGEMEIGVAVSQTGTATMEINGDLNVALAFTLSGDLVNAPFIKSAVALSSTRIRVNFSGPMDDTTALGDPASYGLATTTGSAVVPTVLDVIVPDTEFIETVDLVVSEMTEAGNYQVNIQSEFVTGNSGVPPSQATVSFTGKGDPPEVQVVLALTSTTVEVRFNELIRDTAQARISSNYSFTDPPASLTILEVLAVKGSSVYLKTTEQDETTLYELTINADIRDNANNPLSTPAVAYMLGFKESPLEDSALQLEMYNFLIESIREEDQEKGNQFVERLFKGPQEVWDATNQAILALPKLWSVTEIPGVLLQFMKEIVGWEFSFDTVTQELDEDELRRLVAASVPFWKGRGPEDVIEDIIRLTTGTRVRILNWFDFRWILGETHLGEEHDGFDPWILSSEGQHTYQIRVVDDGTLNRTLIKNLARITRPTNERVEIFYTAFLDQFITDGDKSQWTDESGVTSVAGGEFVFPASVTEESSHLTLEESLSWDEYSVAWKAKGSVHYEMLFYWTSEDDHYFIRVQTSVQLVRIMSEVAGVQTALATFNVDPAINLVDDVYYTFRVEVVRLVGTNEIRLYIDNTFIGKTTNNDHTAGTIGFRRVAGSGAAALDDAELFFIPGQLDFIDINS